VECAPQLAALDIGAPLELPVELGYSCCATSTV